MVSRKEMVEDLLSFWILGLPRVEILFYLAVTSMFIFRMIMTKRRHITMSSRWLPIIFWWVRCWLSLMGSMVALVRMNPKLENKRSIRFTQQTISSKWMKSFRVSASLHLSIGWWIDLVNTLREMTEFTHRKI